MKACMGGWKCSKRDACPHHNADDRTDPAERLCVPGRDGIRLIEASAFRVLLVSVFTGEQVGRAGVAA